MPDEIAGRSAQQKITELYERQSKGDPLTSIFVSKVDSVNWLLNVRGDALAHTPFFHAMLLVHSSSDIVVISEDKPETDFQIDFILKVTEYQMCFQKRIKKETAWCKQIQLYL